MTRETPIPERGAQRTSTIPGRTEMAEAMPLNLIRVPVVVLVVVLVKVCVTVPLAWVFVAGAT